MRCGDPDATQKDDFNLRGIRQRDREGSGGMI